MTDSATSLTSLAPIDLLAKITSLQRELSHLQQQYDVLLEVKNRAAIRYKLDYKKWRNFKRWLHDSQRREGGEVCLPSDSDANRQEPRKVSAKDRCQRFEDIGPDLTEDEGGDGVRAADEIFLPSTIINKPPITQCSPENHVPAQSSARKRRRLSLENVPGKSSQPGDGFEFPQPLVRQTKAEPVDSPQSCKAPGRYAQTPGGPETINSRFLIKKDQNDGVDFQYDAVVRKREQRKALLADDCECCHDYYEAIGPLPHGLQRPLWRSPPSSPSKTTHQCKHNANDGISSVALHKQVISKHRHHWHRAKTPPAYWDIGFPDTQEASAINHLAEQMHRRKFNLVEREANSGRGRYARIS
ncbi:DNA repair protein endonuclease SAE2/CtIP C-terminus-domain-containing protein [Hygrophoropsis aurantiaca]|uniref:DNA repair protein endonuclease SAE2/CtIP C-terminus-domain-containing protein n=1 Tax=Hygrophoropsis aurantiaca TaxID=72124 RepID=A0ACB7ZX62_9AGAM|nr:DNA repair protein endonuclease SAE2/CtIP C-terminus-domain-containing protein [Hygrophoropsis aurantiaca]